MIITLLEVGPIMSNCYVLGDEKTREAVVIDPGDEADRILKALAKDNLTVKAILNTHGHFDHVGANAAIKRATNAPLMIHGADTQMLNEVESLAKAWGLPGENSPPPDKELVEGDTVTFGEQTLKVIHTPGHTMGCISFVMDGAVFVGDTLFAGSIGRTDFPGSSHNQLIASVKEKLFPLGDHIAVYPGHGPETTILREKTSNPFF